VGLRSHNEQSTKKYEDVVIKECNELRIGFFDSIYKKFEEKLVYHYLYVMKIFYRREFFSAAEHVLNFIERNSKSKSLKIKFLGILYRLLINIKVLLKT